MVGDRPVLLPSPCRSGGVVFLCVVTRRVDHACRYTTGAWNAWSMATSTTAGRPLSRARFTAGWTSSARSTRSPCAPITRASAATSRCAVVHGKRASAIQFVLERSLIPQTAIVENHAHNRDILAHGRLDLANVAHHAHIPDGRHNRSIRWGPFTPMAMGSPAPTEPQSLMYWNVSG